MKGLPVSIYRDDYRCHINVLDQVNRATLIHDGLVQLFSPSEDAPAVRIVQRNIAGKPYIHAEPMEKGNYAFGGSFIYSSDSRFSAISSYPIPLHDRDMTKE